MKHALCLLAALVPCAPALADDDHDSDHDRARRAVAEGRILPLKAILAQAEAAYPGQLIEAELEDEGGSVVYEIKILTEGGQVMKLYYDAHTGELLSARRRTERR
ncbi:MAG: PepSY domain-containing protein [Alphaproteobacteria bacterium]